MANSNHREFNQLDQADKDSVVWEMRMWVADCSWADIFDPDELSTEQIIDGVKRNYDGGLPQFLKDNLYY